MADLIGIGTTATPVRARLLLLLAGELAGGAAAFAALLVARPPGPLWAPGNQLLGFAAAFGLVGLLPMRLEFRRHACTVTPVDAVLVTALFWMGPLAVALAAAVGEAVALAAYRMTPIKIVVHGGSRLTTAGVASVAFALWGNRDPGDLVASALALIAAVVFCVLNLTANSATLAVVEHRRFGDIVVRSGPTALLSTLAAAPLGLAALALFERGVFGPVLLVPVLVAVTLNSRHAAAQRDEHLRFERLFDATARTARLRSFEDSLAAAAAEARELATARAAICCAVDSAGEWVGMLVDDLGARPAPAEAVDVLVQLESSRPGGREIHLRDLALPLRLALPPATSAVIAPSPAGSAGTLVLGVFRELPSDERRDSRVSTLAAFAAQSALSVANARLYEEVEAALRQQVDLNRQKSEFVATVSHELRTPLAAIMGSVETAIRLDDRLSPEKRRALLDGSLRHGDRLTRVIEELLLVAATEHSAVHCVAGPVPVAGLLDRVCLETRPLAADRVVVSISPQLPVLHTDEYKLHRILVNLIENAAKYAPEGPIEVQAVPAGRRAVFFVSDHGPGIAPEYRSLVFERFVQIDQSSTRRRGGLGLGLYLCRELSEMLGGELVLTESASGGCCFTLSIALRLDAQDDEPHPEDTDASPWASFPSVARRQLASTAAATGVDR